MLNNILFDFVVCSVYFEWFDGMLIRIYVVNEIKPDISIQTTVRFKNNCRFGLVPFESLN